MNRENIFNSYLERSQQLAAGVKDAPESLQELLTFIDSSRQQNPALSLFFQAEHAFYTKHYSQALKYYLQAKETPFYKFFCYRASAYVSVETKEMNKAKEFIQKALNLCPKDFATYRLWTELQPTVITPESIDTIKQHEPEIALTPQYSFTSHSGKVAESLALLKADAFISIDSREAPTTQQLIHRLYPQKQTSYGGIVSKGPLLTSMSNQKKAIMPNLQVINQTKKNSFAQSNFSIDSPGRDEESLDQRIHTFQQQREDALSQYRDLFKTRSQPFDNILYILQGWPSESHSNIANSITSFAPNSERGFFIRWNGKGIVINPGRHFLENFQQQGLHILDIDYVVITREHHEAYADIQAIYALNKQLNKNSSEIHVIHYYLAQHAYKSLSHLLKPNFKQERDTLHCLELFVDSPDVERIDLDDEIILNYFALASHTATTAPTGALGIQLELNPAPQNTQGIRIGYISGGPWTPSLASHLGACDLLITGFGSTNPNDYHGQKLTDHCLGFLGTCSLIKELSPRLVLCSEFSGADGDIRLEIVKLLRQHCSENAAASPAILAADQGMLINLKRLQVQCSIEKTWVDPFEIRVTRTTGNFAPLQYLSPSCWA